MELTIRFSQATHVIFQVVRGPSVHIAGMPWLVIHLTEISDNGNPDIENMGQCTGPMSH